MQYKGFLLAALLLVSACGAQTTARYASDYARHLSEGQILILPVNAEAYTVSAMEGEERMVDYENHVEPKVAEQLQRSLRARGYSNRILRKADLLENDTYQEYAAFKAAFEASYEAAYKDGELAKVEDAKNSVIRFNGRAKELSEKLGAEKLVYVDYNETVSATDTQVADFAMALAMQALVGNSNATPPDNSRTVIAIIDGPGDRLLWVNHGRAAGGGLVDNMMYSGEEQSDNHIKHTIRNALRALPKRSKLFDEE